jgi:hypothetical protein
MRDLVRTHDLRTAKLGREEACIRVAFHGHWHGVFGASRGKAFHF